MNERDDMAAAARAEIDKIRIQYLRGLPAELAVLEGLAAHLVGEGAERGTIEELRQRLHRLAGSGGTFGLAALGAHARRLEKNIDSWLAGGGMPSAQDRMGLRDDIAALNGMLDDAAACPGDSPIEETASLPSHRATRVWLAGADHASGHELIELLAPFNYEVRQFQTLADVDATRRDEGWPDALILEVGPAGQPLEDVERHFDGATSPQQRCPLLIVGEQRDFRSCLRVARLGAAAFMEKPLDVSRLIDHLERLGGGAPATPYRVLIVDDDVSLAEHYRLVLTIAGMEAAVESFPANIAERIAAFRPELLLLDMYMPGCTGPELATVIRYRDEWLGLPIVYLSAETDPDRQIQALGRGADDFLTKPISDVHLVASVRARVARFRQLADLMSKDSLTGLLKHTRIKEELAAELTRAQRSGKPVSLAMLDIDHFKSVNDTYGHAVGDRVIRAMAQLLRQRLRKSDLIGRYGGEEFVAILPECATAEAQTVLEDVRQRFAALRFRAGESEFACTVSAGIASACDGGSGASLLIAADAALYDAKHGGRNRTCLAPIATGA